MFKSTNNHGYQMTFPNGLTISVQWGTGNYCDRKNLNRSLSDPYEDLKTNIINSTTAEIAVWDENDSGNLVPLEEYDDVIGYCDTIFVANMITLVSQAKDGNDLQWKLQQGRKMWGK